VEGKFLEKIKPLSGWKFSLFGVRENNNAMHHYLPLFQQGCCASWVNITDFFRHGRFLPELLPPCGRILGYCRKPVQCDIDHSRNISQVKLTVCGDMKLITAPAAQ
jgi:hypothetical protein